MKEKKLLDAIGMVGDDLVKAAKSSGIKARKKKRFIMASVAAVLVVTLIAGVIYWRQNLTGLNSYVIYAAEYPKLPDDDEQRVQHSKLWIEYKDKDISKADFIEKTVSQFFVEADSENVIYSPISAYMALGMLAEVTGGDSRQQILDLLGNDSIEELRKEAGLIWNVHYLDREDTKSLLASSVWLDEGTDYKKESLKFLSKTYYASSFHVDMMSDEFEEAMKEWINENTGNMLENQVNDLEVSENAFLVLLNTMYYQTKWSQKFDEKDSNGGRFEGINGSESCIYMRQEDEMSYLAGENFSAVEQKFKAEGGSMYYILPDRDIELEDLFEDEEALSLMSNPGDYHCKKKATVKLSVPKFQIEYQMELKDGLINLGVTEAFDYSSADFSSMLEGEKGSRAVSSILQGSSVAIDEEGCVAATYTKVESALRGGLYEEGVIIFTLDRPFIFVITSDVGMPLFVGVVNYIN